MNYVSTRGAAPVLPFDDAVLAGLATDGGLYLPEAWPTLPAIAPDAGYAATAVEVMWPFVEGVIERAAFETMVVDAYATFDHPEVAPVVPLDEVAGLYLLELFHGPTLAFKDVALQLLGRLFDHILRARGQRIAILGATSGDTGSAAIDACRGRENVDIVILYPHGRVSDVQRRQMTTVDAPNVHAVAVEGTFDDCQDLVKAAFADEAFRTEVSLSAVNSINWARVMAQIVYYVTSARAVRPEGGGVGFCVPTGNFGNILAGYAALRMGLDVRDLTIASNTNDILTRFFTTGTMTIEGVTPTLSPSMDIQVSSNLERLLFEMSGRDGAAIAEMMSAFRGEGTVSVETDRLAMLTERFRAGRLDDDQTRATIRRWYERSGMILDPHTAVGVGVAESVGPLDGVPTICLATAHPAKFPDAVESAIGIRPSLPDHLADLFDRPERTDLLPNDLTAVQTYVRGVTAR